MADSGMIHLLLDDQPIGEDTPELREWQPVEFACVPPDGAVLSLQVGGLALEPFLRPGSQLWRWRWNGQNGIGLYEVALRVEQPDAPVEQHVVRVRVLPRKIDQEQYTALLTDMQQVARALAYRLGAGAEGGARAHEPDAPTPLESYHTVLAEGIALCERVAGQIAQRPRETLRARPVELPLAEAHNADPAALAALGRQPLDAAPGDVLPELQRALRPAGGALPRTLPGRISTPTTDTYENRVLKHVLGLLAAKLRAYGTLLDRERARLERNAGYVEAERGRLAQVTALCERCADDAARVRALRAAPWLSEVAPLGQHHGPSAVMQRDARYRSIYQLWQALRRQPLLEPSSQQGLLPIHELPRLYEIWCALRVAQALLALPGAVLVTQRLIADDDNSIGVALTEDAPLLVVAVGDARLTLRYQPRYRPLRIKDNKSQIADPNNHRAGNQHNDSEDNLQSQIGSLDRHTRVPDLALEVRCSNAAPVVWLLDAKYRLDAGGGVPQQALSDAYAYLGSIGRGDGSRAAVGAWLLYPGRGRVERYPSGVGALPLLPGENDQLSALLAEVIS
jgi:hypothetical protein